MNDGCGTFNYHDDGSADMTLHTALGLWLKYIPGWCPTCIPLAVITGRKTGMLGIDWAALELQMLAKLGAEGHDPLCWRMRPESTDLIFHHLYGS